MPSAAADDGSSAPPSALATSSTAAAAAAEVPPWWPRAIPLWPSAALEQADLVELFKTWQVLVFDLCQSDGRPLDEDVLPPPHLHRSPASPRSEESDHIRSLPRRNSSSSNGRPASLSAASLASEDAMLDSLGPEPSAGCSCSTQPDDCSTLVERVGVAGGSGGGARTSCSLGGGGCECIEASGFFYEPKEDKQPLLKEGKPGVHRHEPRRHHRRRSHSPSSLSSTAVPSKPPLHPRTSPSLSSSSPTFLTSRRERPHQPRLRLPHPPHLPLVECGPGCACPSAIALKAVSLTSVIGSTLQDGWRRPKALLPRPSSSTCANRPTQGKPHPNLVLGRSPLGQLGLFAPTCSSSSQTPAIRAGSFICTYAGELLSTSEARERWAQQADRQEGNYIFSLRENGRPTVHIDPTRIGGIGRFLNHSHAPNLVPLPTHRVPTHQTTARIAFFAARDIAPGEELCWDYGDGGGGGPSLAAMTAAAMRADGRTVCRCAAAACDGFLPFDGDL